MCDSLDVTSPINYKPASILTTNTNLFWRIHELTCTKRGMQLSPRMTARLWCSLARMCRAPTVPSTISSILTPSTIALVLPLPVLATDDRCLCVSWWALINSCTILRNGNVYIVYPKNHKYNKNNHAYFYIMISYCNIEFTILLL